MNPKKHREALLAESTAGRRQIENGARTVVRFRTAWSFGLDIMD